MSRPLRWLICVLLLLFRVGDPTDLAAQTARGRGPIRLAVASPIPRPRSQAPQAVDFVLDSRLDQILEGNVEIKIYVGRKLVQEWNSGTLALGEGSQRLRTLLPPITAYHEETPINVMGRFVGKNFQYDFGEERDLVVPAHWQRWFVLGIALPEERRSEYDDQAIPLALSLDRFHVGADRLDMVTYPSTLPPEDFPATAAGYTCFDVLLLEDAGFSQLRPAQLTAIADWVAAGGSVCVRPMGRLTSAHADFLNRLSAEGLSEPLALDDQGRLPAGFAGGEGAAEFHCGLGRAVILGSLADPRPELETARLALAMHQAGGVDAPRIPPSPWTDIALFLWKVRANQRARVRETGLWDFHRPGRVDDDLRRVRPYGPLETRVESRPGELLLPRRIQGVPLWVVLSILGLFLAIIAPGDYFLLGALRRRRWTWLFLTFASLAFSVGTMQIANAVMGRADFQNALIFADYGRGADPLRVSRFVLRFSATAQRTETTFRDAIFARWQERVDSPLGSAPSPDFYVDPISAAEEQDPPRVTRDLPTIEGRMPAAFAVQQQLRQWSPLLHRETSFALRQPPVAPYWRSDVDLTGPEGRQALFDEILAAEPEARVLVLHAGQIYAADRQKAAAMALDQSAFGPTAEAQPSTWDPACRDSLPPHLAARLPQLSDFATDGPTAGSLRFASETLELVLLASVRRARGLFAIVSQVSPTGADSFEDLALVDPSDPSQWLLVAVVPRENEILVLRRLFWSAP
ncbi:MAG: hypothetical protein ACT4QC_08170 [Planctomycetaceae bacterium]